jgi:hypothetical protein
MLFTLCFVALQLRAEIENVDLRLRFRFMFQENISYKSHFFTTPYVTNNNHLLD